MHESFYSNLLRWRFNFFPAYRASGARLTYISDDFREVRVKLPLNWRTRNVVGTTFGGSMYAAVDPIYMLMLIKNLGPGFIVWDKASLIQFKKPGKATLHAVFILKAEELDAIKNSLRPGESVDRVYHIDVTDASGLVHASVEKTVYIRQK